MKLFNLKILVYLVIFFILSLNLFSSNIKTPYVEITYQDGIVENFEYSSFSMGSKFPLAMVEQGTCESFSIDIDDIDSIYIIAEFKNECAKKDDWEHDVYLINGRQILGYIDVTKYFVDAESIDYQKAKTIEYKKIKKIVFIR